MSIESLGYRLAAMVDTLDNILAIQENPFLPDKMRIDSLKTTSQDIRASIYEIYIEVGGEDVWNDEEAEG